MSLNHREALSGATLFAGLPDSDLDELAERATPRQVSAGNRVFRRGDPAAAMFILLEGEIEISVDDPRRSDKDVVLAVLQPGDAFGELALFDDSPRSATAMAMVDCQLLSLTRSDFRRIVDTSPTAARGMLNALVAMIRRTNEQVADIVLLDVHARMAKAFQGLIERHGEPHGQGVLLNRPVSSDELAGLTGLHPMHVENLLRDYQYADVVRNEDGRFYVPRPEVFEEWQHVRQD